MRGALSSEDVVAGVCQGTDMSPAFALETLRASCQQMRFVADTVPQMVADLRARGLKVVIATDNMDTFQRWTVPSLRLGTLFDAILCSADLGALKEERDPDGQSRFFASYARAQGIGPGESLLLDDGEEEGFGAIIRQFGIDYQHIEPGKGLVPALQRLLVSLF
jgi:FMN phosphatase YigB (HAD superfamily)